VLAGDGATAAAQRLGPEFTVSDLDVDKAVPAVAYDSNHGEYLVVWENDWSGNQDIYAQRVASDGTLLTSFAVAAGSYDREPAVAYDPVNDRYLVVWSHDDTGAGTDVETWAAFVPWDGPPSGLPSAFPVCQYTPCVGNELHPRVAYAADREEFLVVWTIVLPAAGRTIDGRRVFADGGGFASNELPLGSGSPTKDHPALAYDATRSEYLLTWDEEPGASGLDVYGERLDSDATLAGMLPPFAIGEYSEDELYPAVAACAGDPSQYLVAWQWAHPDYDVYARFVSGIGVPGDLTVVSNTSTYETNPAVACSSSQDGYLVVWEQYYLETNPFDTPIGISARDVATDGSEGNRFTIVLPLITGGGGEVYSRTQPAIAAGQDQFLVAWVHHQHDKFRDYLDIHARLVPEPDAGPLAALGALATLVCVHRHGTRLRPAKPSS
jgi:hypothetical protein